MFAYINPEYVTYYSIHILIEAVHFKSVQRVQYIGKKQSKMFLLLSVLNNTLPLFQMLGSPCYAKISISLCMYTDNVFFMCFFSFFIYLFVFNTHIANNVDHKQSN